MNVHKLRILLLNVIIILISCQTMNGGDKPFLLQGPKETVVKKQNYIANELKRIFLTNERIANGDSSIDEIYKNYIESVNSVKIEVEKALNEFTSKPGNMKNNKKIYTYFTKLSSLAELQNIFSDSLNKLIGVQNNHNSSS